MVRNTWDWIVAYLVPLRLYRWWRRWLWDPWKYGVNPFKEYGDARDECPLCQALGEGR